MCTVAMPLVNVMFLIDAQYSFFLFNRSPKDPVVHLYYAFALLHR